MQTDVVLRRLTPALAGLSALLVAPAAGAPAPSLNPLKLCYVSVETAPGSFTTETVDISGFGWTPHSRVDLSVDGALVLPGVAVDESGVLAPRQASAPVMRRGQRRFTVVATDARSPYWMSIRDAFVSALAVRAKPKRARPTQKVRFRGRGFTDRGTIYAHYLRRGRLVKTVRFGRPSGACGTFSVRRRQFPFRPRTGTYLVQIDQHRRLTDDGPLVRLTIDVRRRPSTVG